MTTEEFKKLALLKNNFYKKGGFEIIGEYKNMKSKILCRDKYSTHLKKAEGIIKGEQLWVTTSTNYKEFFYNYLIYNCEYFKEIKNIFVDIINENNIYYCIINTKNGVCKISV